MKPFYKILISFLSLLFCIYTCAQNQNIFTVEAFIQQVKQFHPVVKQANLINSNAVADLMSARGAFDPAFEMNSNNKSLDGINYYQYNNTELKIPTSIGVNFKGGYERSNGQFLNPELTDGVASYLGIELSLLNGFITDKKRTALQQARIYQKMSEQERLILINDLLFNAYVSYWEWAGAYQLYHLYNKYLEIADKRTRLVSFSFKNGDRSMADTIEAHTQLQNYQLLQTEAFLELTKKTLELSLYLWSHEELPYLLPEIYMPDTSQFSKWSLLTDTSQLLYEVQTNHPLLQSARYKLQALEAERKLKFQSLLPTVNLQANLLSKDYFQYKNYSIAHLQNNYKLGVNVKIPLFFRQARGEYKSIRIKIKDNNLHLARKAWEAQNKLRQYLTETDQLQKQIQIAKKMNVAYKALLNTEELKFSQGESSLFLINTREYKVIELQEKLIELQIKYLKASYAIQWASGTIN